MPEVVFWGENGRYGPFDTQEDGWPNAGQVMHYFREKQGITAKAFGKLYGQEVRENGKPICERWILEMELENKVPTDITRRRVIARLLNIPLALFGLASLEHVSVRTVTEHSLSPTIIQQTPLHKVSTDVARYEKNIRVALHLHRTSNAQNILQDINADIRELEQLEDRAKGDLLYRVRELLVGNELLATKIVKDQKHYALAYTYANSAVQVARSLEDSELLATTKYTRGCTKLEWGLFGMMKLGGFQIDKQKIGDAIRDFQDILQTQSTRQDAIHPQLYGSTLLQLSRAQSILMQDTPGALRMNILSLTDQAAEMVGRHSIDDPYTRLLVTGTLPGLHLGGYHLIKAGILNTIGLPGKAISELHQLKQLTEQTYGQDETRSQAWSDIVMAEALTGLEEYTEAIDKAKQALIACHHINSMQNVMMITDIQRRVASSRYGTTRDVEELGNMLKEWYG